MEMTRDEAREVLLRGDFIVYNVWVFGKDFMGCGCECCGDSFSDVEDALDALDNYSDMKDLEIEDNSSWQ